MNRSVNNPYIFGTLWHTLLAGCINFRADG